MSSTHEEAAVRQATDRATVVLFPLIGAVAFITVLLPGPARPAWFIAALGCAALNPVLAWTLSRSGAPRWLHGLPYLLTTVMIAMLVYSAGPGSGLTPLYLLPALLASLVGRPLESALSIAVTVVALVTVGTLNGGAVVSVARSAFFWLAMLTVVSTAIHLLRAGLTGSAEAAAEQARQNAVAAQAARALTVLRDRDDVIRTAVRLATELVSPGSARRAQFFRIGAGVITIAEDGDDTGASAAGVSFPLEEHPLVRQVVATGAPVNGLLDPADCGPELRRIVTLFGVTHVAYVPVAAGGELFGVLSASARGEAIAESLFERLKTIGTLTEVAMQLASAHEQLVVEAGTDPLTGLANRREFERAMERRSTRSPFAVVAMDVDSLKVVNDTHGHAAGDALIRAVAEATRGVTRRGDTVARVGGDEFAVFAAAAEAEHATALVNRIRAALAAVVLPTGRPTVSIGVCVATPDADAAEVWSLADVALYDAKRSGGNRAITRDLSRPTLAVAAQG